MSYPVVLNVQDKVCLVVGGGKVGARKARGLQAEGAKVTVLSSSFYEQIDGVNYIQARYDQRYIEEIMPWLVITATDSHATNAQIQAEAGDAIVIRADDSKAGDAHGLMKREMGGITITAATGVPTFSRYILDEIEAMLSPERVELAAQLKAIREDLKKQLDRSEERTRAWQAITPHYPEWIEAAQAGKALDLESRIADIMANLVESE